MLISLHQKNSSEYNLIESTSLLPHSSWLEVDTGALHHNLTMYKSIAPDSFLAPVVKSNAYGHGLEIVARVCEESKSVALLCVVSISEGLQLRALGIQKPIIVLSILDNDLAMAVVKNIQLPVYDFETAILLNQIGIRLNKKVFIHIKVDTGLSRLGFLWDTAFEAIQKINVLPCIVIQGIFSHLAESESKDSAFTRLQIERFESVLSKCDAVGIEIPLVHISCSAAIAAHKKTRTSLVRLGIGTYGLWPSQENKALVQTTHPAFILKPALTWKTKIMHLKQVPAGSYVGYDRTHQVSHSTLIATLPVGYWDGYDRGLSNRGIVLIHGKPVPVLGRIAMNLMMVDATGINAQVGDEVTLLGDYADITADTLAQKTDTINYEFVTRINPLLPRMRI